ncbi:MAG: hypothetical protein JWQ73_1767 [Variovorax sp.]|jgi:hypothetical protein|nr:hypothetical protein [Variovorax sp.]
MKKLYSNIAVTALAVLAITAAQAQPVTGRTRAQVEAEAIAAAHAPDQNVTRGSRGAETFTPAADPAKMQQQAIATAHAPDQNVTRGSRGADPFVSSMDSAAVDAQARATAAAPDQNVVSGSRVNSRVISTMANPANANMQAQQATVPVK